MSADRRRLVALALTFLPFLWRAAEYARLGSYVPAVVFLALATVVVVGLLAGSPWSRRAIRTWCVAMMLWGTARLTFVVLVSVADPNEAHLRSQLNLPFLLISVAYLGAGIALFRTEYSDSWNIPKVGV